MAKNAGERKVECVRCNSDRIDKQYLSLDAHASFHALCCTRCGYLAPACEMSVSGDLQRTMNRYNEFSRTVYVLGLIEQRLSRLELLVEDLQHGRRWPLRRSPTIAEPTKR